jgi:hypothetical protein
MLTVIQTNADDFVLLSAKIRNLDGGSSLSLSENQGKCTAYLVRTFEVALAESY